MAKLVSVTIGVVVAVILTVMTAGIINDATHGEDDDLYVFVLTGQSNAAYYNYNVNAANEELPSIPSDKAFYYGTSSSPIYYGTLSTPTYDTTFASYGFQDMISDGRYVIGNIDASFIANFVKNTGKAAYIINTGISGQSISNMVPGQPGDDYARDVFSHAFAAIPSGYDVKLGSILFIQGETDTGMEVDTYKGYFEDMFESYRTFTGINSLILSETRPSDGVNSSAAQLELCEELPNVYLGSTAAVDFVNGTRYMAGDGLHYSQYGDNIIGADLADCYIEHFYRSVGKMLDLMDVIVPVLVAAIVLGVATIFLSRKLA